LIASVPTRLAEMRSARFVAWLSLGEAEPGEEELWASGTTDFFSLETRAWQRPIPPSRMRDLKHNNREPNLFSRAFVAGVLSWLERSDDSTDFRDCFYTAGRGWSQKPPDPWRLRNRRAPERVGFRAGLDPTLILEALPAVNAIEAHQTCELRGDPTELIEGRADLRTVEHRLQDHLGVPGMRSRAEGWYERAPVKLWIDNTGLVRRIKYSPLAPPDPDDPQCAWTTLELSDFGTPLERPEFFEERHAGPPEKPDIADP